MPTFGEIMKQAAEQGASFEVLEGGTYLAKIIESEFRSSSTGKPQIKTRWEVTQGPKAGFKGLWNYFTLTADNPNAMAIFYRQMTALGITNEFLATLANVDPDTAMKQIAMALDGRQAQIKVVVDKEYNNNKIERINPLPMSAQTSQAQPGASDPFGAAAAQPAAPAPPVPQAPPVTAPPTPAPVAPVADSTPTAPAMPEQQLPKAPF